MRRLKIGLFIDTFFPMIDGVVNVVDNYAKNLTEYADVTVFCPKSDDRNFKDNFCYRVVRSNILKVPKFDYSVAMPQLDKQFKTELENSNLDIVHIHSPFFLGRVGVSYAKKNNIPCIGHLHSQYRQDFLKAVRLDGVTDVLLANVISVFNRCDICWAVNEGVARLFTDEYLLKTPVTVQKSATDYLPVDREEAIEFVNTKYGLKKSDTVFSFVGRLTTLKNVLFIVDALKLLKNRGIQFKMIFVGSGFDEEKLKKKVKALGLESDVIFAGKITDKTEIAMIYARAKLFLFPSPYDTDGLVKYEAASQGTPTVSIDGLVCASNIKDNVTGFLSQNSAEKYSEKIAEVLQNQQLYEEVSKNVREQLYTTWEKQINKVYNDYLQLAEKRT